MAFQTRLLVVAVLLAAQTWALPQAGSSSSSSSASASGSGTESSTGVPSLTTSTTVASPTVALTNDLPSQVALPSDQAWCPSEIFCAGEILQTVNIAQLYSDPKTFVDKPTNGSSASVTAAFDSLLSSAGNSTANLTEGELVTFVDTYFSGEGLELEAASLSNFLDDPPFLDNVTDPLMRGFAKTVNGYWTQLARNTNDSVLCGEDGNDCESTLIPLNHTFVVPGGRFREQYYWDSYWILKGLIQSQLYDTVNDTLQNFMDELEKYGFIPNGGRIYYLNRSQPPLFIHMVYDYVKASNDTTILSRALHLAEIELAWWYTNRTLNVTSPYTATTYEVARYNVDNSAPRPESYLTDYETANGDDITTPYNDSQKAELYSELASGAESGWDYTSRFLSDPHAGGTNDTNPALRTLNIKNQIPICLNSILYKAHSLIADLYDIASSATDTDASEAAEIHRSTASSLRSAILDLFWDDSKLAFYDFNLTSNARNSLFSAAHFYPLWNGIVPDALLANESAAFSAFASVNMVLSKYNGTFPSTFVETGLQWDAPNAWPPHQYVILEALANIPANVSTLDIETVTNNSSGDSFALLPSGQLGLEESALPGQRLIAGGNATVGSDMSKLGNGTVINGGNATDGETWAEALQRELANRYMASALCSWHATGGSIDGLLARASEAELNVTNSVNNTGNMFEKFSLSDIDSSGGGGEYTVQAGFGWTNGVVLWVAATYGDVLVSPSCPDILSDFESAAGSSTSIPPTATEQISSTASGSSLSQPSSEAGSAALSMNASPKAWMAVIMGSMWVLVAEFAL